MARKFRFRIWKKPPVRTKQNPYWRKALGPTFAELRSKYGKGLKFW